MTAKIDYKTVSELDMADVAGLEGEQLRRFFADIAKDATSAQLRTFLSGMIIAEDAVDDEEDFERAELETAYIQRRMETVERLRNGVTAFDSTFRILMGDDD